MRAAVLRNPKIWIALLCLPLTIYRMISQIGHNLG